MSERPVYVLDASVGVKWFKPEAGHQGAFSLLARAALGEIELAAPTHFAHEVLSVVQRRYSSGDLIDAWDRLKTAEVALLPLTDEVVEEAAKQCALLGCSFYDALAPACAAVLNATLATADREAHGGFPGVFVVE